MECEKHHLPMTVKYMLHIQGGARYMYRCPESFDYLPVRVDDLGDSRSLAQSDARIYESVDEPAPVCPDRAPRAVFSFQYKRAVLRLQPPLNHPQCLECVHHSPHPDLHGGLAAVKPRLKASFQLDCESWDARRHPFFGPVEVSTLGSRSPQVGPTRSDYRQTECLRQLQRASLNLLVLARTHQTEQ